MQRSITGATWTQTDELLASVVDVLQVANWQRSSGKGRRPKPVRRPSGPTERLGSAVTRDEMRDLLDNWPTDNEAEV